MNARVADTLSNRKFGHKYNPDIIVNQNGRALKNIITQYKDTFLVNGLLHHDKVFDESLTYYRGNVSSRNDLCFSNNINILNGFKDMIKFTYLTTVLSYLVLKLISIIQ